MAVRVGLGLSALVLVLGATASATADELSPELTALDVAGEAIKAKGDKAQSDKAKSDEAKQSADEALENADEAAKAKSGPKSGTQVAQNQLPPNQQGQNQGAADEGETEEEEKAKRLPPRVPWRGTAFAWDNSATASALGIGDDFQSTAHQQYVQTFSLGLNYFVIDEEAWSLALATTPSFSVEITESNTTTTEREPWFNDLPVSVAYRRRLHSDPENMLATGLVLNAVALLPTSPASYNSGTYFTTSPRAVLWQAIPVLGKDAPFLTSIAVGASFRWDHRFSSGTTPEQPGLEQPRNSIAASSNPSDAADQLTFNRVGQNIVRETLWLFIADDIGPTQLQIFGAFVFGQRFLADWEHQCFEITEVSTNAPGQCTDVSGTGQPGGTDEPVQYDYGFAIGATFFPMPELGISLGYANTGGQLGEDGQRRNIFYSPYAQFSAGLALSIDAIYEAITGPRRGSPFFLVAQNDEEKKKKNDKLRTSPTQPGFSF